SSALYRFFGMTDLLIEAQIVTFNLDQFYPTRSSASSVPGFVKNGLETATPSQRFQIPQPLVSLVNGSIGRMMEKALERDFERNWRRHFASLLSARVRWEKEQGFQNEDTPSRLYYLSAFEIMSAPSPWLKSELEIIVNQAPEKDRDWARKTLKDTELAIEKIRDQKREIRPSP
ncbi:hypothetical protein EBT16_14645, partial [bacterium]|nr:hypothetical protein [bacterium]